MSASQQELSRSLKSRHITMIALGGAIGAGMFQGSSQSITLAGPSVVLAYALGGLILLFVMRSLASLVVRNPRAGTFRELVEPVLGSWTGYFIGWIYWLVWVLVMAAEVTVSAMFLQHWFSNIPLWVLSLVVSALITLLNLFPVRWFGEAESWLAGIKIATLAIFVLLGGALIFGAAGDHEAVGLQNLTSHGGFFPNGWNGLMSAMLVVIFSFGGMEIVGITLGETQNPEKVIPRIALSVVFRVLVFYVLPILVIVSLVPWNALAGGESPFVTVFRTVGIPYAADLMNFVMLTAVLSATNTGMYAASRMLFRQAADGKAPRAFARLSNRQVPVRALLLSTSFLYIGVIVALFAKGNTFGYLMTFPGYGTLVVWMILLLASICSRRQAGQSASVMSLLSLLALFVVLIGILVTAPLVGTVVTLAAMAMVAVSYRFTTR